MRFTQIYTRVPWRGASEDSGVVRTGDFYLFRSPYYVGKLRVEATIIMRRHAVPYRLSGDSKMLNLE